MCDAQELKLTKVEVTRRWRENNRQLMNTKFDCECGLQYRYSGKSGHMQSQKHIRLVALKKQIKALQLKINTNETQM
jgi:hypothetical protein